MGCIMGCKLAKDHKLHCFPRDPRRRAEWCRILGVYPRCKSVFLCSAHIPACYMMENQVLSRFTLPNPPESRKLITNLSTNCSTDKIEKNISTNFNGDDNCSTDKIEQNISTNFNDDVNCSTVKIEKDISNSSGDNQFPLEETENCKTQTSQETPEQKNKIEDFEIRKGKNNDMIIKGRFIQTDNYLMVSYTPPKKWSLQKQVTLLDKHCTQQLRQIRKINFENCHLRTELKKYERLLPKLRYLQMHNRFLYSQVKMFKLKEKAARKRKMTRKQKEEDAKK